MVKFAVVITTHFFNDEMLGMFRRLRAEAPPDYDVFLALNRGKADRAAPEGTEEIAERLYICNEASLTRLPYPDKCRPEGWSGKGWTLNPGNTDLIVLSFFLEHPDYDYYWGIEYDVHYEGNWSFLFERFERSDADILGTTLYPAHLTPHKKLDNPIVDQEGNPVSPEAITRGFYPIFRLSHRAAAALDEAYRAGWGGHYEMTWATIAKRHGYAVEDIGGNGPYVKPHNRNVFYFNKLSTHTLSPGTFVFKPVFSKVSPRKNTLWHPVKPADIFVWQHYRFETNGNLAEKIFVKLKPAICRIVIWFWFSTHWRRADRSTAGSLDRPLRQ
jgi:hypothetical protein